MSISKNKRLIAVIDADISHRRKVTQALMSFYDTCSFADAKDAMQSLAEELPALIVVNSDVLPGDAASVIKELKHHDTLKNIPVIFLSASETDPRADTAREAGADGVLARPYSRSSLIQSISNKLNANVENEWEALASPQRDALKNSVSVFREISDVLMSGDTVQFSAVKDNCQPLVSAIESGDFLSILDGVRNHDDYTYAHSMRVATLLTLLGHAAGFNNNEQLLLSSGGLLHDVGKMMIPHNILNKPGRLTDEEFEIMKSHVPETIDYLNHCENIPKGVFIIAEQHHEKLDGTGYPHGLKGSELNELARMAAIVDVFSALTDRRVYKEPMEASKAMSIMTEEMAGSHLDPHFIKMFRGVLIDTGVLK